MKRYSVMVFWLLFAGLAVDAGAHSVHRTLHVLPNSGPVVSEPLFVVAVHARSFPDEPDLLRASSIGDGDLLLEERNGESIEGFIPLKVVQKYVSPMFVALELRPSRSLIARYEYSLALT